MNATSETRQRLADLRRRCLNLPTPSLTMPTQDINLLLNYLEFREDEVGKLREALSDLLRLYVGLVASGDCGFWDAEEEEEVKRARSILATARRD